MFFSTSPIKLLKKIRAVTLTLSVVGIVLSGYSIYVHQRKEANKDYKAFCDISEDVSCSKVFTSKWGKGLGILGSLLGEDSPLVLPNGFYGIAFYLLVIALGELQSFTAANIQKYAVLLTNLMSVYLGYILLFVLKDKCVVCFSIYGINFLTAVMCFLRVHYISALKSKKKGNKSNQNVKASGKKNQQNQNVNKSNQNVNKSNQTANKNEQIPKKKKEKVQKQNAEQPVANHQNSVKAQKNVEQHKNPQNNVKNRQNQSKKNTQQNAVQQNPSNKQQAKSNASQSKHSKKKNN